VFDEILEHPFPAVGRNLWLRNSTSRIESERENCELTGSGVEYILGGVWFIFCAEISWLIGSPLPRGERPHLQHENKMWWK
jgi:hypothetical protein